MRVRFSKELTQDVNSKWYIWDMNPGSLALDCMLLRLYTLMLLVKSHRTLEKDRTLVQPGPRHCDEGKRQIDLPKVRYKLVCFLIPVQPSICLKRR